MCLFAIGASDAAYGQQGGNVLKIGIAVPMSGISARVGDETSKVAQWWAKKAKDEHKINVEVVIRDTSFRPAEAINAVERLVVEDKVSAVAGIWHSAQGIAVVPVINRLKVPLVIMGASSPKVMYSPDNMTQKDFVWRPSIDDFIKGKLVGDFLLREMAPKFKSPPKVFYIGEDTDFARDFLESTREFVAKNGQGKLENVGSTLYFAPSSATLVSELAKVRAANPQIVVTAPSGGVMAVFANEMRKLRVPAVDVGYAGEAAAKEFVELTGDNRWGTTFYVYYTPGKPMTSKTLAWEEGFRKAIPEYPVPAGYSAILWECLETIRLAAETAGSTDPEKINAAIPKVKFEGVRNPLVQYDPKTHDTTEMFVAMAQYQQGKPGTGLTVIWPRQVKEADFILPQWVQ
jgi:branched-chain amino acid transport system substrate-binding protein